MRLKSVLFIAVLYCCTFSCISVEGKAAGHLVMPVQFTVENGDYSFSVISIKKNGETIISENGKKNLRLKLEYGNDYLLSFSKPGYITKIIKVDTKVPDDFSKSGFDPYKIGVIIYKQYEGVNIVVYNQPVAFIRYHAELDEFGYDVDYTKSILSQLSVAENTLAKKAAEERLQNKQSGEEKNSVTVSDALPAIAVQNKSQIIADKNKKGDVKDTGEIAVIEKAESGPAMQTLPAVDANKVNSPVHGEGEIKGSSANPGTDSDQPAMLPVAAGSKTQPKMISGDDGKSAISTAENTNGTDIPKEYTSVKNDQEFMPVKQEGSAINKRIVTETIEPNRVVTTIRIVNGDHFSEFRKVIYNWGGVYFFKDNNASISEQLFFLLSAGKQE